VPSGPRRRCRAAIAWAAAALVAAPAAPAAPAALPQQVVLRDDTGARVVLQRPARRIVSLAPSNTESLFAIGAGHLVVGATRFDDYPPPVGTIARVGGFADVDVERVLRLEPDLVLAAGFHAGNVVVRLRALGLAVFVVEPANVADVLDRLELLGRLVGRVDEARRVAAALRARLQRVAQRVQVAARRPRVLLMLSADVFTVAPGSFAHDLIVRAGGDNVAADAPVPYPQLAEEAVIARDPEVIFIGGHEVGLGLADLRGRPGWAGISAVRHGRVVVLEDPDLVSRPGPRVIEALEKIAAVITGVVSPEGAPGLESTVAGRRRSRLR